MMASKKEKKPKLPLKDIKALFERFAGIWGSEWNKRIDGNAKGALKEWAEALADYQLSQIDTAVEVARAKCPWPLRISEFTELCKNTNDGSAIKYTEAVEIADEKIKKRMVPKSVDDLFMQRELIVALALNIYKTQNALADIIFCAFDGCKKHLFVETGGSLAWFCENHKEN